MNDVGKENHDMKVLKSVFVALLFHLIMQVNILIQGKIYDTMIMLDISNIAFILLAVVFGVVVYLIFKKSGRNIYGTSTIIFAAIYVLFLCLSQTGYFMWLFKLIIPHYDETYYELDINAFLMGIAQTIAYVVSSIIYLIKSKKHPLELGCQR